MIQKDAAAFDTGSGSGKRYDKGKLRYDLIQPDAEKGLVEVLTFGASKYEDRNWEKGMPWSKVIGPLKRHLAAIEAGEDYDIGKDCPQCKASTKDNWICTNHSGKLHIDNLQANAHFLSAYYRIYPQGDDRPHKYLQPKKIGLDVDELLCDWLGGWMKLKGLKQRPTSWLFDRNIKETFDTMEKNDTLNAFMLDLKPLLMPEDIPFEPHCYITARRIPNEITTKWLDMYGFPTAPVYTVPAGTSKVQVAKDSGLDVFIDDNYKNFVELNNAGILCYLYDQPHNHRYDVGFKRIYSLKELI